MSAAASGSGGPIRGIHHTSRSVGDMDRSLGFYRNLLGMEVLLDTVMEGEMLDREVGLEGARVRVVELGVEGEPMLELLGYTSPQPREWADDLRPSDAGAHHIALIVDDIAASHTALTEAGVEFTYPPQEVDAGYFEGHWTAYCFDPDHLIVELWQLPR
jgi:catechol 2,3-dioxygenase-like lactoylglutathione lyase family enzyme